MYNITSFTDVKSFMGMPNDLTGGWFWAMMLFSIFIITFILARQKTSTDRSFAVAGFGCWIFGNFLYFLGWVNWLVYMGATVIMILGIISMIVRQEPEM